MTHLRKMMIEELERRNYTESTTRVCLYTVEDLARFFHRPPDQLGPEQIREFTAHMFRVRKLADNTVAQRVAALASFSPGRSNEPGPSTRRPIPRRGRNYPSSSARMKWPAAATAWLISIWRTVRRRDTAC